MTVRVDSQPDVVVFPQLGVSGVGRDQPEPVWDSLSDRQRVAMMVMVSESFRRLADTVESWLPAEVKLSSRADYVIEVTWKNRHLDRTIVELLTMAADDRVRRVDELRDLAGGGDGAERTSG